MWEWFNTPLFPDTMTALNGVVEYWITAIALALLMLELIRYAWKRRMDWSLVGDTLTNFVTFAAFVVVTYGLLAVIYVAAYYSAWNNTPWQLEVTPLTALLCLLLADLAYYWEHRFLHRVGVGWATHTVHHSSPHFNISVAFRFGPMDGFWPLFFHLPLVLMGFNPLLVFAAEALVQIYQTLLHTEFVRKLPRPIEAIFNTPSHHRVHHGSNARYIDRNYGGILIIWDRLFGTFAREVEPVRYGLTEPINSVNPLTVWFHGFTRLARNISKASSGTALYAVLFGPQAEPGADRAIAHTPSQARS
ncbi:MAG: sterol desaturase family protein [Pseudomonadota bacterium]